MTVKIKAADTNFSRCVREASNWTCERCKTQYPKGATGLHCSHIFSRRHRTIRWCKDNVQALCYACHQWFGGNPVDSGLWVTNYVGAGAIELITEKRDSKVKVSKLEEKDIAKHYKEELKKLEERRANGEQGPLDFQSWQ